MVGELYVTTHELKILPEWFNDVALWKKNFEIRKEDRDFQVADILILREWDGEKYTGRKLRRRVKYIYHGTGEYGLQKGYCILGLDDSSH